MGFVKPAKFLEKTMQSKTMQRGVCEIAANLILTADRWYDQPCGSGCSWNGTAMCGWCGQHHCGLCSGQAHCGICDCDWRTDPHHRWKQRRGDGGRGSNSALAAYVERFLIYSPNSSWAEWGSQFLLETAFVPSWLAGSSWFRLGFRCLSPFFSLLSFLRKRVLFHHGFPGSSCFRLGFRSCLPSSLFFLFSTGACQSVPWILNCTWPWWKHALLLFGVYAGGFCLLNVSDVQGCSMLFNDAQ